MIKLKGHGLFYLESPISLWEIGVNRLLTFGLVQDSLTQWVASKCGLNPPSLIIEIIIVGIWELIILMANVYCMITMWQTICFISYNAFNPLHTLGSMYNYRFCFIHKNSVVEVFQCIINPCLHVGLFLWT